MKYNKERLENELKKARLLKDLDFQMNRKDYLSAIKILDELLKLERNNENYLIKKAACLYGLNKFNEALIFSNKSLKINPKRDKANLLNSMIYLELKKYNKSLKYLKKVKNKDYSNSVSVLLSKLLLENKKYKKSLNLINNVLSRKIDKDTKHLALVYKGNIFFNLKKYDKAFSVLKETRKIDNKCIGCLLNMALTTAKQGKLNQSLQYLRIILKINPKEKDARENLVRGLIKLDRKKEAIKNIDYLIKFFGGNTTYYEIKGELLLDLKQYKKALKCFNMSIKKDKNHICPYINKVIIFKNLGDYKSASYSMKIAKRVFSKNKKTASKGTEKEIKKLEKLINKKDVENE